MRRYLGRILLLACLVPRLDLAAQSVGKPGVQVVSSATQIPLGEPFILKVEAQLPVDAKNPAWPVWPDSLPHFEQLQPVKEDTSSADGLVRLSRVYRLTSFDSGRWAIPVLAASANGKTYRSDTLSILVTTVPIEGNAYRDLHEIIEVEASPFPWKRWLAIGLGLLLAGLGIWYYLRNRKKLAPTKPVFESKLSPLEQALASLREIREADLLRKGDVKGYYSRLTDTFRIFATRKFDKPLLAETTDGILLQLSQAGTSRDALSQLAAILRLADAVKFAKFIPPSEDAQRSLGDVEALIKDLNQQKDKV